MADVVTYDSADGIATITINRPEKMNAIDAAVETGLADAWRRFNASQDRVAILAGAGERAFSVGKDLSSDSTPDYRRFVPGYDIAVKKPIIAAVNGWCIGGALTLVMAADLCVAADNARFMYPEAKIGFAGGLIAGLAGRMPHKVAMEVMLLGEELSAERAYQVGFVNKLTPPGETLEAARAYARRLADNAPLVLEMLKGFAGQVVPAGPMERASHALREVEAVMSSDDFREGFASRRENRKPNFTGS
ncbi:enoyl-CoA hydratase-related protein [Hansschlegelia beijingensis]|uniref:Enoyl-CoA hydratase/carnithine racemase n=1 Tax=Hansschlegelia beijingensis TaxID=1133344 RepID=A0A7W6D0S9_9HYPH|nr:enoyl-CoA hydratase-related protein [Hansschlegelia beijingensis]MBB3972551.1 enoyl-CoA hydratase/carnithine racemase [Hansschlegelia beijingensis]